MVGHLDLPGGATYLGSRLVPDEESADLSGETTWPEFTLDVWASDCYLESGVKECNAVLGDVTHPSPIRVVYPHIPC